MLQKLKYLNIMKIKVFFIYSIILLAASCTNPDKNSKAVYIQTEEFSKQNLPFSQAVRYGNMIYVSGQIGDLEETGKLIAGGIIPETNRALKNIKKILEQNGSSIDNIIKCTCMLADISEWGQMSSEYVKFFPIHKPARSAFATTGLALGARVEIECVAYVK
jgi:2-iminobutanoate/2-iminopropanoate deaminase